MLGLFDTFLIYWLHQCWLNLLHLARREIGLGLGGSRLLPWQQDLRPPCWDCAHGQSDTRPWIIYGFLHGVCIAEGFLYPLCKCVLTLIIEHMKLTHRLRLKCVFGSCGDAGLFVVGLFLALRLRFPILDSQFLATDSSSLNILWFIPVCLSFWFWKVPGVSHHHKWMSPLKQVWQGMKSSWSWLLCQPVYHSYKRLVLERQLNRLASIFCQTYDIHLYACLFTQCLISPLNPKRLWMHIRFRYEVRTLMYLHDFCTA